MAQPDVEVIKQKTEALTNVLKEVGTVAYQQAAAAGTASSAGGTTTSTGGDAGTGKVVDAEYKVDQDSGQKKD